MKKYKINNKIVKANSPFEAIKAFQTLKDSGYYWNDIRTMCIKNDWYTYGTNNEYNNLFEKATSGEWKAEQIAKDIQTHSRPDVRYEDVLREVKRLHVYDSKVKDGADSKYYSVVDYLYQNGDIDNYDKYDLYDKLDKNDISGFNAMLSRLGIKNTFYKVFKDSMIKNHLNKSVKDEAFDRSTIDALIADEQAAIDAYNVAIANLKGKLSDEAIKVLQVIRDDEQNHVANLNAILSNNITEKNLEDSIKDARKILATKLKKGDIIFDNHNNPYKITSIDFEATYVSLYADNMNGNGNARFTFDNDELVDVK